jgi:hypothetical protein
MLWLLTALTVVLLVAPVRRFVFSYWYIVLPGIAGIVFGLDFASRAVGSGAPAVILLLAPLLLAAMFIGAVRDVFGGRSRPSQNERRDRRDN